MTTENRTEPQWYFAFRQIFPRPPGQWVLCGPYSSYEEAKMQRERSKEFDAEVSNSFIASDKEEADRICAAGML